MSLIVHLVMVLRKVSKVPSRLMLVVERENTLKKLHLLGRLAELWNNVKIALH